MKTIRMILEEGTKALQLAYKQEASIKKEDKTFEEKKANTLKVNKEQANNLHTINDLLDFLEDKKILKSIVHELVMAAINQDEGLEELIQTKDTLNLDLDYGNQMSDSIGLSIVKNSGSDTISLSLKKDNKVIPGDFNVQEFNKMAIHYRNSLQ